MKVEKERLEKGVYIREKNTSREKDIRERVRVEKEGVERE